MHEADSVARFLERNSSIKFLEAFVVDVNGIARGKWISRDRAAEVLEKGMAMPRSVYALDIWGRDVDAAGLAGGTGDPDGMCRPILPTAAMVPWLTQPTAQVLMRMEAPAGRAFYADPRNVLATVAARYEAIGLTPVVAMELEFYLLDKRQSAEPASPPHSNGGRWQDGQTQVLAISQLHSFEAIFAEIAEACDLQNIPADTILRENGPGQYEINLRHGPDALRAADHAVLLKRIVKGVVRKHGLDATFMAKPYGDRAGSGMHVHLSLLDRQGRNVFAGDGNMPSDKLMHAVGGLLDAMPESTAIFAPHANSFRRLHRGAHAPTRVSWGYDNRTASVRVIDSSRAATRIEHRVAGADSNPYLVLAAILAGAYAGMNERLDPGTPLSGEAHAAAHEHLPTVWDDALQRFAASTFVSAYMGRDYKALFHACKEQEIAEFRRRVTDVEYEAYCSAL